MDNGYKETIKCNSGEIHIESDMPKDQTNDLLFKLFGGEEGKKAWDKYYEEHYAKKQEEPNGDSSKDN